MKSPVSVVRVSTSMWKNHRSLSFKRTISILKRKSIPNVGNEIIPWKVIHDTVGNEISPWEVIQDTDVEEIERIENFLTVADGLYFLKFINFPLNWKTGIVDDWGYKLVPYVES